MDYLWLGIIPSLRDLRRLRLPLDGVWIVTNRKNGNGTRITLPTAGETMPHPPRAGSSLRAPPH